MNSQKLHMQTKPRVKNATLLMGLSGWMDGGDVSTGSIKYLVQTLGAPEFAEIEPEGFYIYNLPGTMNMANVFRPHTVINKGIIKSFQLQQNRFFADTQKNLILFLGREPNLNWKEFGECIFSVCEQFSVKQIYFIGSVAGLVPHTREPRIFCSVSRRELKAGLGRLGVKFTDYEGPASLVTYLMIAAQQRNIDMINLIATVPVYVQGSNPICIEAIIRRLSAILSLHVDSEPLRQLSNEFERKLSDVIAGEPELDESIHKLEQDYDNETFDSEMGDMKQWLEERGVRVD